MPGVPRLGSIPVQGSVSLTYFGTFTLEPYVLSSQAFSRQYSGADQHDQQFSEIPSLARSAMHPCL